MSRVAGTMSVLAFGVGTAFAQTAPPRVEVGGQLNVLRLSGSSDTNVGLGGRVTFDVAPWVSLEGEYQFIPDDEIDLTSMLLDGRVVGLLQHRSRRRYGFASDH